MNQTSVKTSRFFCENCGREVKHDAKVCPGCGRFFSSVRCPRCSFSGEADLFVFGCPNCGYDGAIGDHGRFEMYELAELNGRSTRSGRRRLVWPVFLFWLAMAFLGLAFIVLLVLYSNL
ncbi:MAG: zinc ribbon domain-containing protein [Spirochaetaceae bacterium]|nr:MAG: zinc ribbon domain-containing protein [Spirochaetaceae bacterium]